MAKTQTTKSFEQAVKDLKQKVLPQKVQVVNRKKEKFVNFRSAIKKILDKKYSYRPNIATTRVRQIKDGLKYEWKFKNYTLRINLYADSITIFANTQNKKFVEYFTGDLHNPHFQYPTDKQFALVYDKFDYAYTNINVELNNKILYLTRSNYEFISLNRDLVEHLEAIITTFEEIDQQIELYKNSYKIAKSTVKKITENLKPKAEKNPITYENVMKELKNDWKLSNKANLAQVKLNREYSRFNRKYKHFELTLRVYNNKIILYFIEPSMDLCDYIENNTNFLGFLIMANTTRLYPNFNIKKIYRGQSDIMSIDLDSKNIEIAYLDNHNFRVGAQEIDMPYSNFKDIDHFIQLITFFDQLDSNVSLNKTPKEKLMKKSIAEVAKEKVKAIKKPNKPTQEIISIDMKEDSKNESAIEKQWKALTHEQWMEKSEAARLKLIAAISKDRQVPFVQVKNEESKVITCIQINALDKLLIKDLEDVLTRIEDATQVLNKEKAHKETLIKSIHTKYEEYSKLYKEIKGV